MTKVSRKNYILIMLGVGAVIASIPFIYLFKKWDDFWNKEVIELREDKEVK